MVQAGHRCATTLTLAQFILGRFLVLQFFGDRHATIHSLPQTAFERRTANPRRGNFAGNLAKIGARASEFLPWFQALDGNFLPRLQGNCCG
jgi:hypothetical protein